MKQLAKKMYKGFAIAFLSLTLLVFSRVKVVKNIDSKVKINTYAKKVQSLPFL
jgi:hypothetical protein